MSISRTGTHLYFHAQPYLLFPDLQVQVRLYDQPRAGVISETEVIDWEGMRHEQIGNAQGRHYPVGKELMLWKCFIEDRYRLTNPLENANQATLWRGVEYSPGVCTLYTTWEDIFARSVWQRIFKQEGYHQIDQAVFGKEIVGG